MWTLTGHCVASWVRLSFTHKAFARCLPGSFNRLASRLGGAQSAPRPCARRPSPRAKVARGMPESPTLPAHALGAAFHAGAFRLALGRTRSLAHRTRVGPGLRAAPCPPHAGCHDIQVKFPAPSRASRPPRGPAVGREGASFPYPRHPSSARWSSRAGPAAFGWRSDGGRPGPKSPGLARARGVKKLAWPPRLRARWCLLRRGPRDPFLRATGTWTGAGACSAPAPSSAPPGGRAQA